MGRLSRVNRADFSTRAWLTRLGASLALPFADARPARGRSGLSLADIAAVSVSATAKNDFHFRPKARQF